MKASLSDPHKKRLEKQVATLKSALRVIHTWATFRGGCALDPEHVAKLCKRILEKYNELQIQKETRSNRGFPNDV